MAATLVLGSPTCLKLQASGSLRKYSIRQQTSENSGVRFALIHNSSAKHPKNYAREPSDYHSPGVSPPWRAGSEKSAETGQGQYSTRPKTSEPNTASEINKNPLLHHAGAIRLGAPCSSPIWDPAYAVHPKFNHQPGRVVLCNQIKFLLNFMKSRLLVTEIGTHTCATCAHQPTKPIPLKNKQNKANPETQHTRAHTHANYVAVPWR